jgi:hypothetical protein
MKLLKRGDEVAVLPQKGALPSDVLEIANVVFVGPHLIEVADGRCYFAADGRSLHDGQDGYIVLATEEHRSELRAKLR